MVQLNPHPCLPLPTTGEAELYSRKPQSKPSNPIYVLHHMNQLAGSSLGHMLCWHPPAWLHRTQNPKDSAGNAQVYREQPTHQFNALGKRVVLPVLLWKALKYLPLAISTPCKQASNKKIQSTASGIFLAWKEASARHPRAAVDVTRP